MEKSTENANHHRQWKSSICHQKLALATKVIHLKIERKGALIVKTTVEENSDGKLERYREGAELTRLIQRLKNGTNFKLARWGYTSTIKGNRFCGIRTGTKKRAIGGQAIQAI